MGGGYHPPSPPPLHVWPCPAAPPCAFTCVPAACGLTLSAGSETSLCQVNCQTAQSLKLNIKAVARGHGAISPRPSKRQFWLSKPREDGFPGLGQRQDGAAGDGTCRYDGTVPSTARQPAAASAGQPLSGRRSLPSDFLPLLLNVPVRTSLGKVSWILSLLGSAGWEPRGVPEVSRCWGHCPALGEAPAPGGHIRRFSLGSCLEKHHLKQQWGLPGCL